MMEKPPQPFKVFREHALIESAGKNVQPRPPVYNHINSMAYPD